MRIKVARIVLAAVTAALVTACAGGGGGGGGGGGIAVSPPPSPPPPPPPPPPLPPPLPPGGIPSTTSTEYTAGYAVADTRAITAWQNGATGQGVLVGVIDDGVQATHPELVGRISPASTDIVAGRGALFSITDTHGSELSAIIAGNFNNDATVGLAYNATVLAVRADNGNGGFAAVDLANGIDYAIAQGVKVINFSLGSSTPSATTFQNAIQRATAAGIIVVVSAGNDGPNAPEVNFPGFLATDAAISNNLMLVAGAHDRNGAITSFSNRAGQAQNFFLTAPGLQIIVPDFGAPGGPAGFQVCPPTGGLAGTCQVQGTSYSAPYLTGAVALLLSAFPGLTPQQVVQLVLNAADDAGAPGVDAIYGKGRLNVDRAFQPMGSLAAPLAAGQSVPVSTTLGVTGGAFGDGVTTDPGLWKTVGFDDYGRTFRVDLRRNWLAGSRLSPLPDAPALWRDAETGMGRLAFTYEDTSAPESLRTSFDARDVTSSALRVESALSPTTRVTFAANTPALPTLSGVARGGLLGFAGAEISAAVVQSLGPDTELAFTTQSGVGELGAFGKSARRAFAARLAHEAGPVSAALTAGSLHETGAWLGLAWSPQLGPQPDGDTGFFGAEARWRAAPGLGFAAEGEWGRAAGDDAGWLTVARPLSTSAFALSAAVDVTPNWLDALGPSAQGRITLSLRQPLRVEGGALQVSLPTADAYGRSSLGYETRVFDPAPSGREFDLEAAYDLFVAGRFSARAGVAWVQEPGHIADADPEARAHVGLRLTY